MNSDFKQTYFDLFGLPPEFSLDGGKLDAAYREVQSKVHPDRFAAAPEAERRRSMQWATFANEAYRTLRDPLARARYLVLLAGIDTAEESNTAMPPAFLMQQLEWREAIAEARAAGDHAALAALAEEIAVERRKLLAELHTALDDAHDYARGATLVRELRFLERLAEEIDDAQAALAEAD